jgi:hypothetical protein
VIKKEAEKILRYKDPTSVCGMKNKSYTSTNRATEPSQNHSENIRGTYLESMASRNYRIKLHLALRTCFKNY